MAELDTINIINPTSEDFTWKYNGEPYTITAGETQTFVKRVAFHLAKHLSTQMIQNDEKKKMTKKDKDDPHARIHLKIAQLTIYDTHERRIALYKILKDINLVQEVIQVYPFKGFIGEMDLYKEFVNKNTNIKSEEVILPTGGKIEKRNIIESKLIT
uniref:Uncharacterized protein n=1 Tax=viral metagenome TaxID=1070528 RepID=A0A6H1ZVL5_9ZZZZ